MTLGSSKHDSKKDKEEKEIDMALLQNESQISDNLTRSSILSTNGDMNQNHQVISISELHEQEEKEARDRKQRYSDKEKIFQKQIKIEYRERDAVKTTKGSAGVKGKPAKQKFDWQLYKKLLNYAKREKLLLVSIYTSLMITTLSQTFIPYMVGQLLNDVTTNGEDRVQSTSLKFLGLIGITCIVGFVRIACSNLLGQRVMHHLKVDIFDRFLGYDVAFFEKNKTGDLMSRLGRDVATAKAAVSFNSTMLLRNVMLCLSNIVMLFFLSWKVTLAIIPIIPAYYLVTKYYSFLSKEVEKRTSDIGAASSELVEEVFSGIMTVKSFGQEDFERARYTKILKDEYQENKKSSIYNATYFTVNNYLLANLGILIVLWYGGYIVTSGSNDLSSGDLASFILYSTSLATNSSSISYGLGAIISAMGSLERIFELMQYNPAIKNTTGRQIDIFTGSVTFSDVTFSYPSSGNKVQVLNGISFVIAPGECVAFVGTSGSGKSTIIKLIERFYDVTSGTVSLDNHCVKDINTSSIRKQIGLVCQEPVLFSGTIIDNIVYGVDSYTIQDVDVVCKMAGVEEFIRDTHLFPLGYETVVGERGTKLSGGQKQRVAIARALIKHPQILIFDEATSALDAESEFLVQQSIDSLISNMTMTIIVIAHRLSTIKNCSKIYVMQTGKIVDSGNHTDLISRDGPYKQLVERQLSHII